MKKFMKGVNKFFKWLSSLLLTLLLIAGGFLLFVLISGKIAQKNDKQAPISLYTIISPSMVPNINVYDIVVVGKTNVNKIKVSDVITFYSLNESLRGTPVTHRVMDIAYDSNNNPIFYTKGDNNVAPDKDPVTSNRVVGKVLFKLPGVGRLQIFLASKGGWLVFVLIPALAIISYDIFKIIKLIVVKNKINSISKASNNNRVESSTIDNNNSNTNINSNNFNNNYQDKNINTNYNKPVDNINTNYNYDSYNKEEELIRYDNYNKDISSSNNSEMHSDINEGPRHASTDYEHNDDDDFYNNFMK